MKENGFQLSIIFEPLIDTYDQLTYTIKKIFAHV